MKGLVHGQGRGILSGSPAVLFRLFAEMFALSALVLGGGYVILAAAEERFATRLKWLRPGELVDMLPLFQMIPGIMAGHTAVFVGHRLAGFAGAAVSLAGIALPSLLVFLAVSVGYAHIPLDSPILAAAFLGLRAALTGVLLALCVHTARRTLCGVFTWTLFVLGLVLLIGAHLSPMLVIVAAALVGVACEWRGRTDLRVGRDRTPPRRFCGLGAIPLLFLGYGLIAFGGGYVLVPAYIRDFVGAAAPHLQLSESDFANVMALTQMTPGPIAVNCATYFGFRMGGVPGSVVATLAMILPGSLILLAALRSLERFRERMLVRGLFRGIRPITLALMASATLSLAGMSVWTRTASGVTFSFVGIVLMLASGVVVYVRKANAVLVILVSALLSAAIGLAFPWG